MNGKELYRKYTQGFPSTLKTLSKEQRDYAHTLWMIYQDYTEDIYSLLEQAEKENKKLQIQYYEGVLDAYEVIFV